MKQDITANEIEEMSGRVQEAWQEAFEKVLNDDYSLYDKLFGRMHKMHHNSYEPFAPWYKKCYEAIRDFIIGRNLL